MIREDRLQAAPATAESKLGHTDQDNAGPNCGWCNRTKHQLNLTVTRDHTGWHYHRPDGTEITPRWRPKPTGPNAPP